jgi:hypothetical protein
MPSGPSFREFNLIFHEIGDEGYRQIMEPSSATCQTKYDEVQTTSGCELPVVDPFTSAYRPCSKAINYRSECFFERELTQVEHGLTPDESQDYGSYANGDMATPRPEAYVGDPYKILLTNAGSEMGHVFHEHGGGIRWLRNPGAANPDIAGGLEKFPPVSKASIRLDSQTIEPGESYDLETECGAGGCQQAAGATVWNWTKGGTASAPVYFREPEDTTSWADYTPPNPGKRDPILFDPSNGRYAWPLLQPHLGQRPPFSPNGHSGAPWLRPNVTSTRPDPSATTTCRPTTGPGPGDRARPGPGSTSAMSSTTRRHRSAARSGSTHVYYVDRELGTNLVLNMGNESTWRQGAYGALIAEPKGSVWHDPFTGQPLQSGIFADIFRPDGTAFREYVTLFSDREPLLGHSIMDYYLDSDHSYTDYNQESLSQREGDDQHALCGTGENGADSGCLWLAKSDSVNGGKDPATPVFEAFAGDPVIWRVADAAGDYTIAFQVAGHEFPWTTGSPARRSSRPGPRSLARRSTPTSSTAPAVRPTLQATTSTTWAGTR